MKDLFVTRNTCIYDCVLVKLRETSDQIIIHVDTNDLATNVTTEKIAEFIAHLASTLKSNSCSVFISKITVRSDKHRKKVEQVNRHLEKLCKVKTLN